MTTPIIEALVVAFLAATLASVTAGYIKRESRGSSDAVS